MNTAKLLAALAAVGLWAYSASAANLRPKDALPHIGVTATVCGVVACAKFGAHARTQPIYPHDAFLPVIYGDHRSKFGTPETLLRGERICVTGQISNYHGKPEIVLTDPPAN
jgi:hypothetical protein